MTLLLLGCAASGPPADAPDEATSTTLVVDTAGWPIDPEDDCDWVLGNWGGDGFYIAENDDEWVEADVEWWFGVTEFSTYYSTGSQRTGEYTCDWAAQTLNLDLPYETAIEFADIDTFTWRNLSDSETWGVLTRL